MKNYINLIPILFGLLIIILTVFFLSMKSKNNSTTDNTQAILQSSWQQYKKDFITPEGRVVDPTQNNTTTSEGQSYALLRSVWINDKIMLDRVWKFTKENMKRPSDNLFGWKWGRRSDNTNGPPPNGGEGSASDASNDIALALILASNKWNDPAYITEAKLVLTSLWEVETAEANGKRYPTAGNWATSNTEIVINPSYFTPYAWRIFAAVDQDHDWNSLINPSYELLTKASQSNLDKSSSANLPPDWVIINRQTGELSAVKNPDLTTKYSYDAIRIPWRIALDYQWNKDPQAATYLSQLKFLSQEYNQNKKLFAEHTHDGQIVGRYESASMYATALGYFMIHDKKNADEIYQQKILQQYVTTENTFKKDVPYYEQNWLWFGIGLYKDVLTRYNITK